MVSSFAAAWKWWAFWLPAVLFTGLVGGAMWYLSTSRTPTLAEQLEQQQQRKAEYELARRHYAEALPLGETRLGVEAYLEITGRSFQRFCCVDKENGVYEAFHDLVEIGSEKPPWFCSGVGVYIGFEFRSRDLHRFYETHDSDTLTTIRVFSWPQGCL